jgi:glutathione S-transferase
MHPLRPTAPSMTLLWSSRSPFVRKVMVTAHETGMREKLETRRVVVAANKPSPEVMSANPLNKIPTLLLADGTRLYDSRVICEFFDSLHPGPRLFPSEPSRRWRALRLQALGDGLMEVGILRLGEQNRAAASQSATHLSSFKLKLAASLDHLEAAAAELGGELDIGQIAVACALAHLDFRFATEAWRRERVRLAAWYEAFAARPSMQATQYVDAY